MRRALIVSAALALSACSGESTTGGGTANSPFVGTYTGASSARVSAVSGVLAAQEPVSIFVHRDGLVQFGDAGSTIYVSGHLHGDRVRVREDAAALVHPSCSGTITVAGTFSLSGSGHAAFNGEWSADSVICFGTPGDLDGPIYAERIEGEARASRVFQTNSPALLKAFRNAAR